ncbi:cytochrome c-type biogenesis protein [Sessilibacter corallicola]|uniref:Cytochrome c-type biogenesis protein n=1 Tax=Sessilibacter corallicola TaxID=2904075 RepID=A0ABQ0AA51_9GAMM|nr:cytochrome c-type biogenesis protein [Sessilibacter corallicola]MCE2029185.1 cytochrome c-type biogenesis protein CcmH [Sessilibacter corallicola]
MLQAFRPLVMFFVVLYASAAFSVVDIHEFDSAEQEARYQQLVHELRCPKCQNQNLNGSDSQIAKDLRREVYRLLKEGKSDSEIKDFMVARYGDFVLYKPRLQSNTYVLWFAPVAILLIGAVVVSLIIFGRRPKPSQPSTSTSPSSESNELSSDEQARLKAMLENPELNGKD